MRELQTTPQTSSGPGDRSAERGSRAPASASVHVGVRPESSLPHDLCAPDQHSAQSSEAWKQEQLLWLGGQQIHQLDKSHPPQLPESGLEASPGSAADSLQSPPPQPSAPLSLLPSTSNYLVQLLGKVIQNSTKTEITRDLEPAGLCVSRWWSLRTKARPRPRVSPTCLPGGGGIAESSRRSQSS